MIQETLTSKSWKTEDEMKMLFQAERYFVFDAEGTLFDKGYISYDEKKSQIFLDNSEAKGSISVAIKEQGIYLDGELHSPLFGTLAIQTNLKPIKEKLKPTPAKSIQEAALDADLERVKDFLKKEEINTQDDYGNTALHMACSFVSLDVINFLLKAGADVNLTNNKGQSPLHMAVKADHKKAVLLLLKHGAKTDVYEDENHLLRVAVQKNISLALIKVLVKEMQKSAKFSLQLRANSHHILSEAMLDFSNGFFEGKENKALFKFLLSFDMDLEQTEAQFLFTPFLVAVAKGAPEIMKLLIAKDVNVHALDKLGRTALDVVCLSADKEDDKLDKKVRKVLIDIGVTQTKQNKLEENLKELKNVSTEADIQRALNELETFIDEVDEKEYRLSKLELLLKIESPSILDLDKSARTVYELYYRGQVSPAYYVDISTQCFEKIMAKEADKTGMEYELIKMIRLYLREEEMDEALLLKLLKIAQTLGEGIPLDALEAEGIQTPKHRDANELVLKIYDKLKAFNELYYLDAKARFLLIIEKRWMNNHFDCHNEMLAIDVTSEIAKVLGDDLRYEFDQRHRKSSDDTSYPLCPVPTNRAFDRSIELYKDSEYAFNCIWYFRHKMVSGFGDKKAWYTWIEVESKYEDALGVYEVYAQALESVFGDAIAYWAKELIDFVQKHEIQDKVLSNILDRHAGNKRWQFVVMPLIRQTKPNLNRLNKEGDSYLLKILPLLASENYDEDCRFLFSAVKDVDVVNASLELPLFFLFANTLVDNDSRLPQLKMLKEAGADVNYQHIPSGETCLYHYAQKGMLAQLKILIESFSCHPAIATANGLTPLDVAQESGHAEVVDYLKSLDIAAYEKPKPRIKSIDDIYDDLYYQEVETDFLVKFKQNLERFSESQSRSLFHKMETAYKDSTESDILEAISDYFNAQEASLKISSNLISFMRVLQMYCDQNTQKNFALSVQEVMKKSFALEDSYSTIRDTRNILYRNGITSEHLPDIETCSNKLFDEDTSVQEEYAQYLSSMAYQAKDAETLLIKRLAYALGDRFSSWQADLLGEKEVFDKTLEASPTLLHHLLDTLGSIGTQDSKAHLLILYCLSSNKHKVKDHARDALSLIGKSTLPMTSLAFNHLQEDYARVAVIESIPVFSGEQAFADFLENIETEDSYLKERIKDALAILSLRT